MVEGLTLPGFGESTWVPWFRACRFLGLRVYRVSGSGGSVALVVYGL